MNDKGAWYQLGYANRFDNFTKVKDNVERIHVKDVSPQAFIEKYEKPYKPVVIQGIQENWDAHQKWTLEVSMNLYILSVSLMTCELSGVTAR